MAALSAFTSRGPRSLPITVVSWGQGSLTSGSCCWDVRASSRCTCACSDWLSSTGAGTSHLCRVQHLGTHSSSVSLDCGSSSLLLSCSGLVWRPIGPPAGEHLVCGFSDERPLQQPLSAAAHLLLLTSGCVLRSLSARPRQAGRARNCSSACASACCAERWPSRAGPEGAAPLAGRCRTLCQPRRLLGRASRWSPPRTPGQRISRRQQPAETGCQVAQTPGGGAGRGRAPARLGVRARRRRGDAAQVGRTLMMLEAVMNCAWTTRAVLLGLWKPCASQAVTILEHTMPVQPSACSRLRAAAGVLACPISPAG